MIRKGFWRRTFVMVVAVGGFVALYEATMLDSKYAARQANLRDASTPPAPGERLPFRATAYCKGLVTSAGVAAQSGVVASDPELLPVGSVIQIDSAGPKYNGIYSVLDTGPSVQGREVDLYMWSCYEALAFGRRSINLTVLRLGWNPAATTPGFLDRFLKRPGTEPLPSRPLPLNLEPAKQ